jgi:hypothetical protein
MHIMIQGTYFLDMLINNLDIGTWMLINFDFVIHVLNMKNNICKNVIIRL